MAFASASDMTSASDRGARGIVVSVVLFVALLAASMALYPGGTSWDPGAHGHDFWRNFLCDLERTTALDGSPNPVGARLGQAAMLVLAGGLLPFFHRVGALAPGAPRLARTARVAGTIAVLAVPGVTFVSGDRFGALHSVAVVLAGAPGLVACGAAFAALVRDRAAPVAVRWAGGAALLVAAVDFAMYVASLAWPAVGTVAVAVLERLANGGLLVWMLLAAAARPRPAPGPAPAGLAALPVYARSPGAAGLDSGSKAA